MKPIAKEISDLEGTIAQRTAELAALKEKQERLEKGDPRAIADLLHDAMCHWNHTDGCGYFYESWDSGNRSTRSGWLEKAHRVKKFAETYNIPLGTALEVIVNTARGWV